MSSTESVFVDQINLVENDINFDTPNRNEILRNGLRRPSAENLLGRGSFGTVFKGVYKGRKVAVKIIKNQNNGDKFPAVINEINILNWDHENIIKILHVESTLKQSAVIMERFQGQCLQLIIDQIELSVQHRLRIAKDIICGLNYCHKNGILHLDIKPQNILVAFDLDTKNDILKNYSCKICDFGSSQIISKNKIEIKLSNLLAPIGTIRYMSPEALKNENLTPASDIYSYGVTIWQLKSRILPYYNIDCNDTVAYKVVKVNLRPSTPTEDIENCFQFNNTHNDCICQQFSSEISSDRNRNSSSINNLQPLRMLSSSPFRRIQKEYKNLTSEIKYNNNFKEKNNELLDLDVNFYQRKAMKKLKFSNISENCEQNLNLEEIFVKRRNSQCELKEQLYKAIYTKCWNNNPLSRPSGAEIENNITKLLK
ncbi:serine/threonine-protein kinase mos [Condylostylus longicornis]|uniref:serine/threonine-protein kinase mos n=1 Tax=Condylostylus longicornis TaxID=2530218 RepID=UPI00244DFE37|nr:serine/threonine-protein kinase mos [Condylostylus longicornis]